MLDDLVKTIETLKARINGYQWYFGEGKAEARTRVALIDPMLSALGWDTTDPGLVEIEPKTKEGWADYALMSGGRTVMFVEAKKLSENIDHHFQQTINYAVGENVGRSPKVDYCAVTNGDAWKVLDVREQEIILSTSIARDDSPKAALQFLGLWRQSLRNGGFDAAVEPILAEEQTQSHTPTAGPAPETPTSGRRRKRGKLSDDEVREIRRLRADGAKQTDIAKQFNVRWAVVSRITRRRSYKDVV